MFTQTPHLARNLSRFMGVELVCVLRTILDDGQMHPDCWRAEFRIPLSLIHLDGIVAISTVVSGLAAVIAVAISGVALWKANQAHDEIVASAERERRYQFQVATVARLSELRATGPQSTFSTLLLALPQSWLPLTRRIVLIGGANPRRLPYNPHDPGAGHCNIDNCSNWIDDEIAATLRAIVARGPADGDALETLSTNPKIGKWAPNPDQSGRLWYYNATGNPEMDEATALRLEGDQQR